MPVSCCELIIRRRSAPRLYSQTGPEHYALWKHLPDIIRDGRQNAFVREFRQSAFDYAAQNPEYACVFDEAMSSYSGFQAEWTLEALEEYDFSKFASLCDVAGGQGHLLGGFLVKYSSLKGILFERPSVIMDCRRLWTNKGNVADRCEFVGGDMFKIIPKADAHIMKLILQDWNDNQCVQILSNAFNAGATMVECSLLSTSSPVPRHRISQKSMTSI